jgi:hypothetical protein
LDIGHRFAHKSEHEKLARFVVPLIIAVWLGLRVEEQQAGCDASLRDIPWRAMIVVWLT